jgi:hypothetical protein
MTIEEFKDMIRKKMSAFSKSTLRNVLKILGDRIAPLSGMFSEQPIEANTPEAGHFRKQIEKGEIGEYADMCGQFALAAIAVGNISKEDKELARVTKQKLLLQNKRLDIIASATHCIGSMESNVNSQLCRVANAQIETVKALSI